MDDQGYVAVSLDRGPDEIAAAFFDSMLIHDPLASTALNSAKGDEGLAQFKALLMRRLAQRSLEKDEVIEFVERNRPTLEEQHWVGRLLQMLPETGEQEEGEEADGSAMLTSLSDTLTQMQLALDHRPAEIDVVSNRLLWLCTALDMKIRSGYLTHEDAVSGFLTRPATQSLMTPKAVLFLLSDYLNSMDELDEPRPGYVMLATECALLVDNVSSLKVAAIFLAGLPPPPAAAPWLDLRERLRTRLLAHDYWGASDEASLAKALRRYDSVVGDDDL